MTMTTPPQETRTRRPRRRAGETDAPARRRTPAERPAEAAEDATARPAKTGAARSGAARSGATGTATRSATTAPAERRTRRPAPKRKQAAKPATKQAAKPAAKQATRQAARPATGRPGRQVKITVVRRQAAPPRTPFVLLVVGLLGGALVSLLLLNTVLAQDAFTLSELQRDNKQLSERKQALQEDINRENSPAVLHAKARALGMVDGKRPAFIDARTGRVTEGGTRPPGVSDDAMAAAAGAGVTGAPGAIMPPPAGSARPHAQRHGTATTPQRSGNGETGGGTR
jgi:cell division protein FtsB